MSSPRIASLAVAIGLFGGAACSDDARTQIMVVVDTTLVVPDVIDVVRVVVTGPAGRAETATGSLAFARPVLVGLVPADDGALDPVTIVVEAAATGGAPARSRTVRTSFVEGRVKELRVVLDDTCDPTCPELDLPGASLPDWTGSPPSIDGAIAPRDALPEAAQPPDAGPDAGDPDAGAPTDPLFVDFVRQLSLPDDTSRELAYRMEVSIDAEPRNVSAELDAAFGPVERTDDRHINASSDGAWIVITSARGECVSWSCVYLMPANDVAAAEPVYLWMESEHLHSETPVVAPGGETIVSAEAADHPRDIIEVHRTMDGWERGPVLTRESPYPFNTQPWLSPDASRVVFLCSHEVYGDNDVCEVAIDGTRFRVVARHDEPPPPLLPGENESLWHPSYEPDASIVFEAEWGHLRQIWRVRTTETVATRVHPATLDGFTQPCALPDGRIATLTRVRGGDADQISIATPDGRPDLDLLVPWEPGQLTHLTGCGR